MLALLAASALAAGACSSGDSSTSSSAVVPSVLSVTENFSGTVQPGSSDAHSFTVTTDNAAIALTLTSVGPPATIAMGFGVGQTVAGTCQLLSGGFGTYTANSAAQLSGTIPIGTYCVMVYD